MPKRFPDHDELSHYDQKEKKWKVTFATQIPCGKKFHARGEADTKKAARTYAAQLLNASVHDHCQGHGCKPR